MPALRSHPHPWTIEEVERLIDERDGHTPRYELVDGELLVSPGPVGRHQRIVGRLFLRLTEYVDRLRLGEVRLGPGSVRLTTQSYLEPDLFVIPAVNGKRARANDTVTSVLLAAEVLSPGSIRHDRITKRKFFERHGVPEYWVVDGDAATFEVWHPGSCVLKCRINAWRGNRPVQLSRSCSTCASSSPRWRTSSAVR